MTKFKELTHQRNERPSGEDVEAKHQVFKPICSMYGIFISTYICWVTFKILEQMLVNIPAPWFAYGKDVWPFAEFLAMQQLQTWPNRRWCPDCLDFISFAHSQNTIIPMIQNTIPIGSMYTIYILTFGVYGWQMLPYIAYMDSMGYKTISPITIFPIIIFAVVIKYL